ncbi:hypothetical protein KC325_g53 [Hortaea werneckii]|nr:hypothetical protein KC325_g53 [Hortaea werneckii]
MEKLSVRIKFHGTWYLHKIFTLSFVLGRVRGVRTCRTGEPILLVTPPAMTPSLAVAPAFAMAMFIASSVSYRSYQPGDSYRHKPMDRFRLVLAELSEIVGCLEIRFGGIEHVVNAPVLHPTVRSGVINVGKVVHGLEIPLSLLAFETSSDKLLRGTGLQVICGRFDPVQDFILRLGSQDQTVWAVMTVASSLYVLPLTVFTRFKTNRLANSVKLPLPFIGQSHSGSHAALAHFFQAPIQSDENIFVILPRALHEWRIHAERLMGRRALGRCHKAQMVDALCSHLIEFCDEAGVVATSRIVGGQVKTGPKLTCQVVYTFAVFQLISINVHEVVSSDGVRFSMAMIAMVSPWSSARCWRSENCWQSQQRSAECSFHSEHGFTVEGNIEEVLYTFTYTIGSSALACLAYAKPPQCTPRYMMPSSFGGGHPKAVHASVLMESMDAVKVGRRWMRSGRKRKEETGTTLPRKRRSWLPICGNIFSTSKPANTNALVPKRSFKALTSPDRLATVLVPLSDSVPLDSTPKKLSLMQLALASIKLPPAPGSSTTCQTPYLPVTLKLRSAASICGIRILSKRFFIFGW